MRAPALFALLAVLVAPATAATSPAPSPPPRPAGPAGPGPGGPPPQRPPSDDVFSRDLFRPQLVVENMDALGVAGEQREKIRALVLESQARARTLAAAMAEARGRLESLLHATPIDEAAASAALDALLGLEGDAKKSNFTFLVRLKNMLTPEQQTKLAAIRDKSTPARP